MKYEIRVFFVFSLFFVFQNAFGEMKVYEQTIETEKVIAVYDAQQKVGHLTVFPCETCDPRSFVFDNSLRIFVNDIHSSGELFSV